MSNGKKLTREEVIPLFEKRQSIREDVQNHVHPVINHLRVVPESAKFIATDYNAFIFDADLVTRFFNGQEDPNEVATHLVVFIGAQHKQDQGIEIGDPTVILAGCTFDSNKGEFETLRLREPASEHPPKFAKESFPPAKTVKKSVMKAAGVPPEEISETFETITFTITDKK